MASNPALPTAARVSGPIVAALLIVAAALAFVGIYYALNPTDPLWARLAIGILAVALAAASYLAISLSKGEAPIQRYTAWGFFAFGFAVLLVTLALPSSAYTLQPVWRYVGLTLVVIALAGAVAGIGWRSRGSVEPPAREAARAEWRSRPPVSAFDYATARSPDAPSTSPPPPPSRGP